MLPAGAMNDTVTLHEAKTQLSRLVERAAQGEEIVIAKAGRPMAKLAPWREPADLLELAYVVEDFDDPLPPEVQAEFESDP